MLDLGKRNLTASLALLRGLEGLSASPPSLLYTSEQRADGLYRQPRADDSISRLELLLPRRDYRSLAASLAETKRIVLELEGYKTLERVREALQKVGRVQAEVRGAVMEEFEG